MAWWAVIAALFGGMTALMLTGLPVAFAFLIVNLAGGFFLLGGLPGLTGVVTSMFSSITTFTLLPVPFFILMGEIVFRTGLGLAAVNALERCLGRLPGRLSILAVLLGVLVGALSGSTIATCALLGTALLPEMLAKGYSRSMSLGPLMGVGTVDALIPPNALTVVLASLAGVDVGGLLVAGILPGVLLAASMVLFIAISCRIHPHHAPVYAVESIPWRERAAGLAKHLLPLGFLVFMVLGLIILGVATPTEAAATGALGAFLLAFAAGRLTREAIKRALAGTLRVSVMILMIVVVSSTYSEILAFTGAAEHLVALVAGLGVGSMPIVIGMLLAVVFLGCFMETVAIMMITIPVFMPIVRAIGCDPLWFCVVLLIALETGLLTPPFGVTLFVMKGVAPPEIEMTDVWKAAAPYVLIDMLCLAAVLVLPSLALLLPRALGMR